MQPCEQGPCVVEQDIRCKIHRKVQMRLQIADERLQVTDERLQATDSQITTDEDEDEGGRTRESKAGSRVFLYFYIHIYTYINIKIYKYIYYLIHIHTYTYISPSPLYHQLMLILQLAIPLFAVFAVSILHSSFFIIYSHSSLLYSLFFTLHPLLHSSLFSDLQFLCDKYMFRAFHSTARAPIWTVVAPISDLH